MLAKNVRDQKMFQAHTIILKLKIYSNWVGIGTRKEIMENLLEKPLLIIKCFFVSFHVRIPPSSHFEFRLLTFIRSVNVKKNYLVSFSLNLNAKLMTKNYQEAQVHSEDKNPDHRSHYYRACLVIRK